MSATAHLLEAIDHGDAIALDRLGWRTIWDLLNGYPQRPMVMAGLRPYVQALGERDPDDVAVAVRELGSAKYRPAASEIDRQMGSVPPAPSGPRRGRRDLEPTALAAVAQRVAAGAQPCTCLPRSADLRQDTAGVLTCPLCGGIEFGQYTAGTETAL